MADHQIPEDHKDWKIGKRRKEPEKGTDSLDKLQGRIDAQLPAGDLPRTCVRRVPIGTLLRTHCSNMKRKHAKQQRADASVKRLHG